MSKLLLLVHNESDVQHLNAAAKAILNSSITGVWVVFSPAITVNASEAAKKLDGEIEQLKTAETQAAARTDYTAAEGYKQQREGKELDRQKVLRDAWKTAPEEARKAKTQEIFKPFAGQLQPKGLAVRITGHSDHYDREQWVTMLNSLSGVWFKEFVPGQFVIGWPESVETSTKMTFVERLGLTSLDKRDIEEKISKSVATNAPQTENSASTVATNAPQNSTRREELEEKHHMSLRPLARKYGITATDKPTMIKEILAAESKVEPEPALSEY